MNLYSLIKVLHILVVTAVIAGVIGRALIRARLVRLDDIYIVREFVLLEGRFDQWLVVYGSITTLLTGLLLTWLGHWPLLNAGVPTWTLIGAVLFLSTIPLVIWVYLPRGKIFSLVFQEALAKKRVTVELRTAFSDRVIRASYLYEYIMLPIVLTLMVIKPFLSLDRLSYFICSAFGMVLLSQRSILQERAADMVIARNVSPTNR